MISAASLHSAGIPRYMHEGIIEYVENGRPMGSFLTAVFNNDLVTACRHADDTNRHLLFNYVSWLHDHAPVGCYGSPDSTEKWPKLLRDDNG